MLFHQDEFTFCCVCSPRTEPISTSEITLHKQSCYKCLGGDLQYMCTVYEVCIVYKQTYPPPLKHMQYIVYVQFEVIFLHRRDQDGKTDKYIK